MMAEEKSIKKEEEEDDPASRQQSDNDESSNEEEEKPLYKSTRFKGYLTLTLASSIHWKTSMDIMNFLKASGIPMLPQQSFAEGFDPNTFELEESRGIDDTVLRKQPEETQSQAQVAVVLGMISMVVAAVLVLIHLDSFTPLKKFWRSKVFKSKSKIEFLIILFFCIWWTAATIIETQSVGLAGSDNVHYNLYFSVWMCWLISIWTLERWCVASKLKSIAGHLASWPNRSPGWIGILIFSSASLCSVAERLAAQGFLDEKSFQWGLLFSTIPITIVPSVFFVLVELFRPTKENDKSIKSTCENIFEGICLLILVLMWIPTVIVSTTPGGAAAHVGNAYFFLWFTVLFLMDTAVWWIHDWRMSVRLLIIEEQKKYRQIQREIMKKTREAAAEEEERLRSPGSSLRERFFSFESLQASK